MAGRKHLIADSFFTAVTLVGVFLINLFLVARFDTKTMTPMIFVLGVFPGFLADPRVCLWHRCQFSERSFGELGIYLSVLGL